jgi:hypothetical protein
MLAPNKISQRACEWIKELSGCFAFAVYCRASDTGTAYSKLSTRTLTLAATAATLRACALLAGLQYTLAD